MIAIRLLGNQNTLFWLLNGCGWFTYFIVRFLIDLKFEERSYSYIPVLLITVSVGFLLTLIFRYIYQKWRKLPIHNTAMLVIALCTFFGLVWHGIENYYQISWYNPKGIDSYARLEFWIDDDTFYYCVILMCWSVLYFGIKYYQQLQSEVRRTILAEKMANEAQLKMLRYQLNPHFLFNTLNAISTLILDRQISTANSMVSRLSEFLRYSLDNDPIKKLPLKQELHALNLYLSIEKVRFEERLQVEFDIDEKASKALIPSLLLQPIIENSMKYAIAPRQEGGHILIKVKLIKNMLWLQVIDDGQGIDESKQSNNQRCGVGIVNTRSRLRELYENDQQFLVENNQPRGLKVSIIIPFET